MIEKCGLLCEKVLRLPHSNYLQEKSSLSAWLLRPVILPLGDMQMTICKPATFGAINKQTYPEKRSTWNLTVMPSNVTGFFKSSVISFHSFCSPSELRNNILTRHAVGSGKSWCVSPNETGSVMVTGFKNSTVSSQTIRSIGPISISLASNSSPGTSCA